MGKGVEKVRDFMKKEAVLCIALGLAILSVFWQPVDKNYLGYIDWNTLMLLFCLMAAMAGFQRLGIFQKTGDFLLWMLPYTLVTGICIGLAVLFQRKEKVEYSPQKSNAVWGKKRKFYFISYVVMFLCCLASVSKMLPPMALFFLVLAFLFVADRRNLCCIDYALLGTFVAFFIFIGNLGRVPAFRDFFARILTGHETLAGVMSSQVISNVPAALLLSGFTDKWESLVIGTNLGGLGTLIASMASLISYKQIVRQYPGLKGRYFLYFTLGNVGMLLILLGVYAGLGVIK